MGFVSLADSYLQKFSKKFTTNPIDIYGNLYLENNNILNNFFKEVLLFNIEQIIILFNALLLGIYLFSLVYI